MDIKHRPAYAELKLIGVRDPVIINSGMSLMQIVSQVMRHLAEAPPRYEGEIELRISFKPRGQYESQFERDYKELLNGLDLTGMEMEQEDDPESERWARNPMNKDSPAYDVIYEEYQRCNFTPYRERKTTEDQAMIRKHVESNYAGTEWWDGSHRW